MRYLILSVLLFVVLLLALIGREKLLLRLIIFVVPIGIPPLLQPSFALIPLSGFLIWTTWLGTKMRGIITREERTSWYVLSQKVRILYYFLVAGAVLGSLHIEDNLDYYVTTKPLPQIIIVSFFVLSVIIFLKLLVNYRYDIKFQNELMYSFVISVFLQLATIVVYYLGYSRLLPGFLVSQSQAAVDPSLNEIVARYSGLLGDYELIVDYVMMVVGLGVLLYLGGKRLIGLLAIAAAVLVGLMSGTRSFIVVMIVFTSAAGIGYLFISRSLISSIKVAAVLGMVFLFSIYLYVHVFRDTVTFQRLEAVYNLLQSGASFQSASNRSLYDAVPVILNNVGIFGNGAFLFFSIKGNVMVYHNLLFALYAKYGIVGVTALLYLFVQAGVLLMKLLKASKTRTLRAEGLVLLGLLLALFMQQMKISAIRILPSILMYCLFFTWIYFFKCRAQLSGQPK